MKKVVLLGDSLRQIGYGTKLPKVVEGEFEVWQPEYNCCYSVFTFRKIHEDREAIRGADLIHWNNGIWDVVDNFGDGPFTDKDTYVKNMKRIAKILLTLGKKVVFATTTPVRPGYFGIKDNAIIEEYNAAIVPELEKMGVIINDLYNFVKPKVEVFISDKDHVHLTEEGIDACAQEVAEFIRKNI